MVYTSVRHVYNTTCGRFIFDLLVFQLVAHWTLVEGVYRQFDALREGFESVFSLGFLNLFYPDEVGHCGNRTSKQIVPIRLKHFVICQFVFHFNVPVVNHIYQCGLSTFIKDHSLQKRRLLSAGPVVLWKS